MSDISNGYIKGIKPYVERPFIPLEVDSLAKINKRRFYDFSMAKATIVGDQPATSTKKVQEVHYIE